MMYVCMWSCCDASPWECYLLYHTIAIRAGSHASSRVGLLGFVSAIVWHSQVEHIRLHATGTAHMHQTTKVHKETKGLLYGPRWTLAAV